MDRRTPEVVAHRGASADEPEHTLAAYRRAIDLGADGLECDVRLTADGHLVCVHDRRVNRTSSGRGLVSTLELTQLEGLDWGSWKLLPPAAETVQPFVVGPGDRSHLLTLRRLLEEVTSCGRDVRLAIETKHPTRWGGLVERALVALLDEFGLAAPADPDGSPVRIMSFSALALRRMRALAPGLPLVQLVDRGPVAKLHEGRLPAGVLAVGMSLELLRHRPAYADRVRDAGGEVHVWVVNTPEDVRLCRAAGVETIITDRPAMVLGVLGRGPLPGRQRDRRASSEIVLPADSHWREVQSGSTM